MLLRILSIALLAFTLAVPNVGFAGQTDDPITIGSPKKGDPDKKHKKGGKKHKKGGKKHKKGGKKGKKGGKKHKKGDKKKHDRGHKGNRRFK